MIIELSPTAMAISAAGIFAAGAIAYGLARKIIAGSDGTAEKVKRLQRQLKKCSTPGLAKLRAENERLIIVNDQLRKNQMHQANLDRLAGAIQDKRCLPTGADVGAFMRCSKQAALKMLSDLVGRGVLSKNKNRTYSVE